MGRGRRSVIALLGVCWGLGWAAPAAPAAVPDAEEASPEAAAAAAGPAQLRSYHYWAGAAALSPEQGSAIEQAWFTPADSLERRVWRTRRTALELGVWNLDGVARALLGSPRTPIERAEAAVRLAPDLPAGYMRLAHALWMGGGSPLSAVRTAAAALAAFARHPEGAPWLVGSLLTVLAAGLVCGGLLCIAVTSLFAAPHAAHDLGDLFSKRMPPFGRAALLAGLLLLPVVLGEGVLGLLVLLAAVGIVYGSNAQRGVLVLAAAAVVLGAYPVAGLAGATFEALPADPVAQATLATTRGLVMPADVARLEAAADQDLLARQGLARLARRAGNLGQADALYQSLVRALPDDPTVLNNAANVRLHLGHMEAAFDLYRRALEVEESPVVLYNLSQAYGRAFQVDDLTRALELAQGLDGDLVADLTRLQGAQPEGFVVDLPLSNRALWTRIFDPGRGGDFAQELRQPLAPGRLGRSRDALAGAFASVVLGGWLLGRRHRSSRWCDRCGRRVCPRCHPEVSGGELCAACHRLFYRPEQTNRELRLARIEALRQRGARLDKIAWAASVVLPGVAGVLARRPLRCLLGALLIAIAVAALVWRQGVVPDPLVAGAAGPFAFLCVAALAGIGYAVVVGASLAARRNL